MFKYLLIIITLFAISLMALPITGKKVVDSLPFVNTDTTWSLKMVDTSSFFRTAKNSKRTFMSGADKNYYWGIKKCGTSTQIGYYYNTQKFRESSIFDSTYKTRTIDSSWIDGAYTGETYIFNCNDTIYILSNSSDQRTPKNPIGKTTWWINYKDTSWTKRTTLLNMSSRPICINNKIYYRNDSTSQWYILKATGTNASTLTSTLTTDPSMDSQNQLLYQHPFLASVGYEIFCPNTLPNNPLVMFTTTNVVVFNNPDTNCTIFPYPTTLTITGIPIYNPTTPNIYYHGTGTYNVKVTMTLPPRIKQIPIVMKDSTFSITCDSILNFILVASDSINKLTYSFNANTNDSISNNDSIFTIKPVINTNHSDTIKLKVSNPDTTIIYTLILNVYRKYPTKIESSENNITSSVNIYPNPFNPSTKINYYVSKTSQVKITIYSIDGSIISTLVNNKKASGRYSILFNGNNIMSGTYICKITIGSFEKNIKLVMIK